MPSSPGRLRVLIAMATHLVINDVFQRDLALGEPESHGWRLLVLPSTAVVVKHPEYAKANAAWGVKTQGAATRIGNLAREKGAENTIWTPMIGSEVQHHSNQHVYDKLVEEFNRQARMGNLPPELQARIAAANKHGVFGTKMRSVINLANPAGVAAIVKQQFEIGKEIIAGGLVPIIEPEVNIKSPEKAAAEDLLKKSLIEHANNLSADQNIMLKLSIPTKTNLYQELVSHPRIVRVVALSGGYSRDDANKYLAQNTGVIASFSRALAEGLTAQQSDTEFDRALDTAIQSIYEASSNK